MNEDQFVDKYQRKPVEIGFFIIVRFCCWYHFFQGCTSLYAQKSNFQNLRHVGYINKILSSHLRNIALSVHIETRHKTNHPPWQNDEMEQFSQQLKIIPRF